MSVFTGGRRDFSEKSIEFGEQKNFFTCAQIHCCKVSFTEQSDSLFHWDANSLTGGIIIIPSTWPRGRVQRMNLWSNCGIRTLAVAVSNPMDWCSDFEVDSFDIGKGFYLEMAASPGWTQSLVRFRNLIDIQIANRSPQVQGFEPMSPSNQWARYDATVFLGLAEGELLIMESRWCNVKKTIQSHAWCTPAYFSRLFLRCFG